MREARSRAKAFVQCQVRELKNKWWSEKASEIQKHTHTRGFFSATKAVCGPSHRGSTLLWSKDRQKLLKTDDETKTFRREYFEELLNQRTTADKEVCDRVPQYPMREGDPPGLLEVHDAISMLRNNKAVGPNGIPAKIVKGSGDNLLQHIHTLIIKL